MLAHTQSSHSSTITEAHTLLILHLERMQLLSEQRAAASASSPAHHRPASRRLWLAVAIAAVFAALALTGRAQSTFGSIRGTVADNSGAVVPDATIVVRSLDDNAERTTTSGASGEFVFENLKAGAYKVIVHRTGFADAMVPSAHLEARQELRLPITLSVAADTTTVEVSAGSAQINTENGTVSDTMSNEDIAQMPMNSRAVSSSPLASLALSPSVVQDSQGNISVGGATAAQTGFSVDGVSTANVRSNGALHDAYPSSEGISETKVTAYNNNAEFAQIGDVTFTTKSGTNKWHGSAFEYFQNDVLDATVYDFPTKAPKNFNTFGGSVGGPVILPHLGALKDRTFFFADYEGNRKTQSYPEQLLVPTAQERAGNLTELVRAAGQGAPVNNPFTGQAYANNTIPTINPVAAAVLARYPLPNASGNGYNYQTLVAHPFEQRRLGPARRRNHLAEAERLCALQLEEPPLHRRRQRPDRKPILAQRDRARPESQPAGVAQLRHARQPGERVPLRLYQLQRERRLPHPGQRGYRRSWIERHQPQLPSYGRRVPHFHLQ